MSDYLQIDWIGVDGSEWDLINHSNYWMAPKPGGLYDAKMKTLWIPYCFGNKFQGEQVQRRDPVFTMYFAHEDPEEMLRLESAWRKSWRYNAEGTLRFTKNGESRDLKLRLLQEPQAYDAGNWEGWDPHIHACTSVVMQTAAEFPYFVGETKRQVLTFPETGNTPITKNATVFNDGDVEGWVEYVGSAPASGPGAIWTVPDHSWGNQVYGRGTLDATRTFRVADKVKPGEDFHLTARPDVPMLIAANGANLQGRCNGRGLLYPIPEWTPPTPWPITYQRLAGDTTSVGEIEISLTALYSRPWGVSRID